VKLELASPRGERALGIYAAAHIASGNPPSPQIKYQIEYSTDKGQSWKPIVKDWRITRTGEEPPDFWSQSFCYGSLNFPETTATSVQIRFRNDGGKKYLRAEAHLVYRAAGNDPVKVAYAWRDSTGDSTASHTFEPGARSPWRIQTATNVQTRWVEMGVGK
jgi:hypothetical protein